MKKNLIIALALLTNLYCFAQTESNVTPNTVNIDVNSTQIAINHFQKGIELLHSNDANGALVLFNTASEVFQNHPGLIYYKGLTKLNLHDINGAVNDLAQLQSLDKASAQQLNKKITLVAIEHFRTGISDMNRLDCSEALEHFEQALIALPNHPGLVYFSGLAKYKLGKYDAAIKDFYAVRDDYNCNLADLHLKEMLAWGNVR